MKQFDWERALEAPSERFHAHVQSVLSTLPEQEEMTMKHTWKLKRVGLLAAAAVLVLSIGVAAANNLGFIRSDWRETRTLDGPAAVVETLESGRVEGVTADARFLETYSNGFTFASGELAGSVARADEDPTVYNYQSVSCRYERNGAAVDVDISPVLPGISDGFDGEAVSCGDVTVYAQERDYLVVPLDYEPTPEELDAQAAGTLVLSYDDGLDAPQTVVQRCVTWMQDGMRYSVNAMDGRTELAELTAMAQELINS